MSLIRVAVLGLALVTAPSFGFAVGNFTGKGSWTAHDGCKGVWTHSTSITKNPSGNQVVKESLSIEMGGGKTMTQEFEWTAVDKGNGFFDVEVAGGVAGWGFCDTTQCRVEIQKSKDESYGETYLFGLTGISRYGHDKSSRGTVVWNGKMNRK